MKLNPRACAINPGIFAAADFPPATLRGWTALVGRMNADGSLGFVQPPGKEPASTPPRAPDVQPYAQGAFWLAGVEVAKMFSPSPVPGRSPR